MIPGADLATARAALAALLPDRAVEDVAPLGRGHIHATFVARVRAGAGSERFVVQRINTHVFRDPEALAANLARVTDHVRAALRARGVADLDRRCLRPVVSPGGSSLHRGADGSCWRAFPYLEGTHSLDTPRSSGEAEAAARAFGAFLADLSDLAPDRLVETIPSFHDLGERRRALEGSAHRDAVRRARGVAAEIDALHRACERVLAARELAPGALPRRVVHNDCKLNNLLFDDASGEALCVVDLDTVMPGTAAFDFGELARTGACPADEDERNLSRVRVDRELFGALARGFVAGARGRLDEREVRALAVAGPLMALENAVRFLTDHLDGDRYFRIARPGHNLDRARAQLRLAESMLAAEGELRAIIEGLATGAGGSRPSA